MAAGDAPYHAHIYYSAGERAAAEALRDAFVLLAEAGGEPPVLFVGRMVDEAVGPHRFRNMKSTSSSGRSPKSSQRSRRRDCAPSSIRSPTTTWPIIRSWRTGSARRWTSTSPSSIRRG